MVDVATISSQFLAAFKNAVPGAGDQQYAALQTIATDFADTIATTESDRAAGTINDNQVQDSISAAADAAKVALQAQIGIGELQAKNAVIAGLQAVGSAAAVAAGLPWLVPILNLAIGAL